MYLSKRKSPKTWLGSVRKNMTGDGRKNPKNPIYRAVLETTHSSEIHRPKGKKRRGS